MRPSQTLQKERTEASFVLGIVPSKTFGSLITKKFICFWKRFFCNWTAR